jgi:heat-inducible transcriptional repressor
MLTSRQECILCKVVDGYLRSGLPVPSKAIAADPELDCGASTVRSELALLEELGLLNHPHTSAGRIPTDAGYRHVVDRMLYTGQGLLPAPRLDLSMARLSVARREVEDAMRTTTETLSQATNLLAVVSAPSPQTATIRHVEVLDLQPNLVMAVLITSTGDVAKVLATLPGPVDPGLLTWAGEYLNERLVGLSLGARMLHQRLADPTLPATERAFLDHLAPGLAALGAEREETTLYFEGAARLLSDDHLADVAQINDLVGLLERRVALLDVLRAALGKSGVYVRIGHENPIPAMRSLALVAAGYGVAQRKLGTVSVIGPVRMDYAQAIPVVREAAFELSRFVEDAYGDN